MQNPWYYDVMQGSTGIAFVGCVHTVTPELMSRMNRLLEYVDQFQNFALVFGGDLSSSKLLDDMKRHFYDAKRGIAGNIESLIELVDVSGGFDQPATLDQRLATVKEEEYIGPWIGKHCSEATRTAIEQGFIENTDAICSMVKPFLYRGAQVMVCGGNWEDVQCTRDTLGIPNIPDHVPVLRGMGVKVFMEMGYARVGEVGISFLPYWSLEKRADAELEHLIDLMGNDGPLLDVTVAHAEPNWAVHNQMVNEVPPARAKVIEYLDYCLSQAGGDHLVYSHQHAHLKSEDGFELGDNVKYLLAVDHSAQTVRLVHDSKSLSAPSVDTMVANYIPFQKIGFLSFWDSREVLGVEASEFHVFSRIDVISM